MFIREMEKGKPMAKFLDASKTNAMIIDIIKNAEEFLFLVSPYIKLTTQYKNYLQGLSSKNLDLFLIYRSDRKLDLDDEKFLLGNRMIKVSSCENLHAKCYFNEQRGIITSLNLYEHSQVNNWEMGVLFDKNDDVSLYESAFNELKLILQASTSKSLPAPIPQTRKARYIPEKKGFFDKLLDATLGPEVGYCIRCGKEQDHDPNRPLCPSCYLSWSKHANPSYKERYCHHCGEQRQTSYEKPICYECFKEDYRYLK